MHAQDAGASETSEIGSMGGVQRDAPGHAPPTFQQYMEHPGGYPQSVNPMAHAASDGSFPPDSPGPHMGSQAMQQHGDLRQYLVHSTGPHMQPIGPPGPQGPGAFPNQRGHGRQPFVPGMQPHYAPPHPAGFQAGPRGYPPGQGPHFPHPPSGPHPHPMGPHFEPPQASANEGPTSREGAGQQSQHHSEHGQAPNGAGSARGARPQEQYSPSYPLPGPPPHPAAYRPLSSQPGGPPIYPPTSSGYGQRTPPPTLTSGGMPGPTGPGTYQPQQAGPPIFGNFQSSSNAPDAPQSVPEQQQQQQQSASSANEGQAMGQRPSASGGSVAHGMPAAETATIVSSAETPQTTVTDSLADRLQSGKPRPKATQSAQAKIDQALKLKKDQKALAAMQSPQKPQRPPATTSDTDIPTGSIPMRGPPGAQDSSSQQPPHQGAPYAPPMSGLNSRPDMQTNGLPDRFADPRSGAYASANGPLQASTGNLQGQQFPPAGHNGMAADQPPTAGKVPEGAAMNGEMGKENAPPFVRGPSTIVDLKKRGRSWAGIVGRIPVPKPGSAPDMVRSSVNREFAKCPLTTLRTACMSGLKNCTAADIRLCVSTSHEHHQLL